MLIVQGEITHILEKDKEYKGKKQAVVDVKSDGERFSKAVQCDFDLIQDLSVGDDVSMEVRDLAGVNKSNGQFFHFYTLVGLI